MKRLKYIWPPAILLFAAIGLRTMAEPPSLDPIPSAVTDAAADEPRIVLPVRVERVVDGDTLDVTVEIRARVRLLDCWAPEAGTETGAASTGYLQKLAESKRGWLSIPIGEGNGLQSLFSFGRILGRVSVGSVDVSEEQVRAGHATKEKQ